LLFGRFHAALLLRSSLSGALTHPIHCVGRLRKRRLVWSVFPQLTQSLRRRRGAGSWVRAQAFPLLFSATVPSFRFYRHPPPPNNSFKPTPCRGVGHVHYATLAHVRRPATGRLNSSVRRQKSVWWLCFGNAPFPGFVWHRSSVRLSARCFFGYSFRRARTSRALRWSASDTVIDVVMFPATDTVASVTSGGKFSGARTGFPAPAFGKLAKVRVTSASPAT
jgi:hypothetical protein